MFAELFGVFVLGVFILFVKVASLLLLLHNIPLGLVFCNCQVDEWLHFDLGLPLLHKLKLILDSNLLIFVRIRQVSI